MSRTIARLSAIPAAIADWISRNARNASILGAKMQPIVAARNTTKQTRITGRRPNRSDSGPSASCSTAVRPR